MPFRMPAFTSRRSSRHEDADAPAYGDPETFYRDHYAQLPFGHVNGFVTRLSHGALERPFGVEVNFPSVLEVGAGEGLHLPFVRHRFDRYLATDVSAEAISRATEVLKHDPRVTAAVVDAEELPFPDGSFDRLVATCVLIHLANPERALTDWRRVVRCGGVLSMYLPHENGIPLRLGRAVSTAPAVRRSGFEGYPLLLAREHRNSSRALDVLIRHVFRHDSLVAGGWPIRAAPLGARVFTAYHVARG